MSALSKVKVVQIDASRDHSVFLDSKLVDLKCTVHALSMHNPFCQSQISVDIVSYSVSMYLCMTCTGEPPFKMFTFHRGDAYTCGFNEAHQLGQGTNPTTAPHSLLSPLPVHGRMPQVTFLYCGASLMDSDRLPLVMSL